MELTIKLYGEIVARLDSNEDPMGWLLMQPTEVREGWQHLSVREWKPERTDAAIQEWLMGLLPEGPSLDPFQTAAGVRTRQWGTNERQMRRALASLLWANADRDFAGAVTFEGYPNKTATEYRSVTEAALGELVAEESKLRDERARPVWPRTDPWNKSALAGMRGKTTATPTEGGGWTIAEGKALDTWIVKHEDRSKLPGEAGVEAIAQRALRYLGVRAATTVSRVIGTEQCVLSERSDRYRDDNGIVRARHQEDFLQASGWDANEKRETNERGEPRYPLLYQLLGASAYDAQAEQDRLTAVIATCVFAGNADMHRKNIGLLHPRPRIREGVILAPVYDFATWPGLERTVPERHRAVPEMALGVNGVRNFGKVGPKQWIALASDAGVDSERMLDVVRNTGRALPEALAQARDEAATEDENKEQGWVERRIEATIKGSKDRANEFRTRLDALSRKRVSGRPKHNGTRTGGSTRVRRNDVKRKARLAAEPAHEPRCPPEERDPHLQDLRDALKQKRDEVEALARTWLGERTIAEHVLVGPPGKELHRSWIPEHTSRTCYITAKSALNLSSREMGPAGDWHSAGWWFPVHNENDHARTAFMSNGPLYAHACAETTEVFAEHGLVDARGALEKLGHPAAKRPMKVWAANHVRAIIDYAWEECLALLKEEEWESLRQIVDATQVRRWIGTKEQWVELHAMAKRIGEAKSKTKAMREAWEEWRAHQCPTAHYNAPGRRWMGSTAEHWVEIEP